MDLKQGDLENIILNALWDLESAGHEKVFVGNIQDKIKSPGKKWAYTTVKTVLDRLVDKEIAVREKDGKKYLYRSVLDRDQAGLVALRKVARQYFRNDINELMQCLKQMKPELEETAGASAHPTESFSERLVARQQLEQIQQGVAPGV